MIFRGIATFSLDEGKCPRWLFERMVRLGREIMRVIIEEFSPEEFLKRVADPVWFQSLGTVLAFDWNSSGLTTILTAVLKEALRGQEKDFGLFICGGKGKTSRKTPEEIINWSEKINLPVAEANKLVYTSRLTAKVDNALVQDGFQLYHHTFFFSKKGSWAVVQQGMNPLKASARRYHWYSEKINDLVCEPHTGIASQLLNQPTLDLTAKKSQANQKVSLEIIQSGYQNLLKDLEILRKHSTALSQMLTLKNKNSGQQLTLLNLENREFFWHPVLKDDFLNNRYLKKILYKATEIKPKSYEELLALEGVGPKTIRALALVAEVIYGAKPSYQDPARYAFAHGGKDRTPYPVDRFVYDQTIAFFEKILQRAKLSPSEKQKIFSRLK